MPARYQTATATIPLSGTVTGDIGFLGIAQAALHIPTLTTCSLWIQGNYDTTSANFVRIQKKDGSGVWAINGAGSMAIPLDDVGANFPYLRIETSVAQAAARTLTLIYKVG